MVLACSQGYSHCLGLALVSILSTIISIKFNTSNTIKFSINNSITIISIIELSKLTVSDCNCQNDNLTSTSSNLQLLLVFVTVTSSSKSDTHTDYYTFITVHVDSSRSQGACKTDLGLPTLSSRESIAIIM